MSLSFPLTYTIDFSERVLFFWGFFCIFGMPGSSADFSMSVFHCVTLPCPWLLSCVIFYIWYSKILQNKYWCGLVKSELWAIEINNNYKIFWLWDFFWLSTQAFIPAFSLWIGLFFPCLCVLHTKFAAQFNSRSLADAAALTSVKLCWNIANMDWKYELCCELHNILPLMPSNTACFLKKEQVVK